MLDVGWGEILVLAVIALVVFGPERLPKFAADAGRMLRQLREMARKTTDELKAEFGPEIGDVDLRSLHPRRFVQKALFDDDDGRAAPSLPPVGAAPPLRAGERPPFDPDAT